MTIRDKIAELFERKAATVPGVKSVQEGYSLDPQTALANAALAAGTSNAPVAQGGYAWADGLARVLQGGLGGYMANKQKDQYSGIAQRLADAEAASARTALSGLGDREGNRSMPEVAPVVPPTPVQQRTLPPVAPSASTPPLAGAPPALPAQGVAFNRPLAQTGRVTSEYGVARPGHKHNGIDIAAPEGSPIDAAAGGVVERVYNDTANGGGLSAIIRHPDGSRTGYAHALDFGVKAGDEVQPGQVIGRVGRTGNATGPTLHFTVRDPSGKRVDPNSVFGRRAPEAAPSASDAAVPSSSASPAQVDKYGVAIEQLPTTPEAEPAGEAPRLRRAYETLARGDQWAYDAAQAELSKALGEQTDLNEAAVKRRQDLKNATFDAANLRYAQQQERLRSQGFTKSERLDTQTFDANESALERASRERIAAMQQRTQLATAGMRESGGKPLPFGAAQKLSTQAGSLDALNSLGNSFDPRFVGRPVTAGLGVLAADLTGGDRELSDWWKQYNGTIAGVRHNLFGSAFTDSERKEFNKLVISPRTNEAVARDYLARQQAIVETALGRVARSAAVGYGNDAVEAAIGRNPATLRNNPNPAPAASATAPYSDPAKEARYQAWRKAHPNG